MTRGISGKVRQIPLRTKVNLIALALALIITLFVPLGYGLIEYRFQADLVAFKAHLGADRIAKYIYSNEKMWQYQKIRLDEIIELPEASDAVEQRIFDEAGNLLVVVGALPGRFRITRSVPLVVVGTTVGRLEVDAPLDPSLLRTGVAFLISLAVGFAAYFAVRVFPLKVLDRTLGHLETANHDLEEIETSLKLRSGQLIEAQHLGKFGDWSYRLGSSEVWWAPEIYDLLGYKPETFGPTRDAVLSIFVGDTARLALEAEAEVMRSGMAKSVDVKVKRGDGRVVDFAMTSKALTDAEGRVVGLAGTMQDISERKLAEEQLQKLAYYDPLTGLANRALFQSELDHVIARARQMGTAGALLLLDLDRFKEVNDSLGHAAGDELLVRVGRLITRVVGKSEFLARLGGDEFAIILPECGDQASIERVAGEVIAAVSGSILLERGEVVIGTSIGIAQLPRDGANSGEVLRNADLALYRAKEDGRGRFTFFQPEMNAAVQYKAALARDLRRAVSTDVGLYVHYQPQLALSSGRVTGFEALMRWNHPTRGNVPPAEFIPVAESSNLICDLGFWILRESAMQAKAWLDAGEPVREVAVNMSAAQVWHTDLESEVARVLEETGLPPHLLCLDLTEGLLVDYGKGRVRTVLTGLKRLGVTLALDDFGTDYSSLGYLTQLPFDRLKVDRVFIEGITNMQRSRDLLKGIIALGRGLGMMVVGEGAETAEEVEILRELGCDLVQGYYLARPTVASEALVYARRCEPAASAETPKVEPRDATPAPAARLRIARA